MSLRVSRNSALRFFSIGASGRLVELSGPTVLPNERSRHRVRHCSQPKHAFTYYVELTFRGRLFGRGPRRRTKALFVGGRLKENDPMRRSDGAAKSPISSRLLPVSL